jgi:hypothetical protein
MAQYGHQCLHSCYACVEQHKVDPSHRCIRGVKNCTWCESTGMACNQEGQGEYKESVEVLQLIFTLFSPEFPRRLDVSLLCTED